MLPLFPVPTPNDLTARVFNALLRREQWAADRLSLHAGKTVQFIIGSLRVSYTIESTGLVRVGNAEVVPDVTLTIAPQHLSDLPGILRSRDVNAITQKLHVQGEAALATLVSELARDLRWDIEEDAAAVFGDFMGPRLLNGAKAMFGMVQQSGERVAANLGEYLGEEGRMLATRSVVDGFTNDVAELSARLSRLEQRFARLSGTKGV
jgi:Uncharacterized protein conserved in bacteria